MVSTISSVSFPAAQRLIDSGARTVHVSEIPGSAERGQQMLDNLVLQTQHRQQRLQRANAEISTAQANVTRVESIIKDLPSTTPASERKAWAKELAGARDYVRSTNDELALASGAQASFSERLLKAQKFIAGHLGIPLDTVKAVYAQRLDKSA